MICFRFLLRIFRCRVFTAPNQNKFQSCSIIPIPTELFSFAAMIFHRLSNFKQTNTVTFSKRLCEVLVLNGLFLYYGKNISVNYSSLDGVQWSLASSREFECNGSMMGWKNQARRESERQRRCIAVQIFTLHSSREMFSVCVIDLQVYGGSRDGADHGTGGSTDLQMIVNHSLLRYTYLLKKNWKYIPTCSLRTTFFDKSAFITPTCVLPINLISSNNATKINRINFWSKQETSQIPLVFLSGYRT